VIESSAEFVRLRLSDDLDDQRRAGHEAASEATWRDVIRQHSALRRWVAYNKTVPLSVLAVLADDEDPDVRFAVAMKRKLDAQLFEKLAGDPAPAVRRRIALNPKCPSHILRRLAKDNDDLVRTTATSRLRKEDR
jgi:hypothetical protein